MPRWCAGSWGSVDKVKQCSLDDMCFVCYKQLFRIGVATGGQFFSSGSGLIFLDDVRCQGNESNLVSCPRSDQEIGHTYCTHYSDAGVICHSMPLS